MFLFRLRVGFPSGASSVLCKRPFSLRRRLIWAVEKWESRFWISTFPRPTVNSSFWSSRLHLGTTGFRLGRSFEAAQRACFVGAGDPRLASATVVDGGYASAFCGTR